MPIIQINKEIFEGFGGWDNTTIHDDVLQQNIPDFNDVLIGRSQDNYIKKYLRYLDINVLGRIVGDIWIDKENNIEVYIVDNKWKEYNIADLGFNHFVESQLKTIVSGPLYFDEFRDLFIEHYFKNELHKEVLVYFSVYYSS